MTGPLIHGVFRLIPRTWRFKLARSLAALAGSRAERCLGYFLAVMDERRLPFDPEVTLSGFEELRTAAEAGRGALVIATHGNAGMARLILRALDEARVNSAVLSHAPGYPICGTGREVETIRPAGTFLLAVRSKLRSGSVVCGLIDSPEPLARDAAHVVVDGASLWLSTPLIRVAIQWQVPVFFLKGRFAGRAVAVELQTAPVGVPTAKVIDAFAAFLPAGAASPTRFARSPRSLVPRRRAS